MSDQCKCCIVRGDYKKCLSKPCYHHENWINKQRIKKLSEARADALRMARVVYEMQSFDCSTCVRRDYSFGESYVCNRCSECEKWEARDDSEVFEAQRIIAKYEDK